MISFKAGGTEHISGIYYSGRHSVYFVEELVIQHIASKYGSL